MRAFYESYLWILQTLLLTHPDLHPGLLGVKVMMHSEGISYKPQCGEVEMCPQVGRMGPIKR